MDDEEGRDVVRGGAESRARESEDCGLEARVSVMNETHREMQDEMALPDVAMREATRVRAAVDTMELSLSEEEEEDDIGVSAGMREAVVEEAAGQADAGDDESDDGNDE